MCLQVGTNFTVALAANTEGAAVMAADVRLAFGERALRVIACVPGGAILQPAGFECRFNMPRMLGSAQVSYVSMGLDQGQAQGILDPSEPSNQEARGDGPGIASGSGSPGRLPVLAWLTFQVHSGCFIFMNFSVFISQMPCWFSCS